VLLHWDEVYGDLNCDEPEADELSHPSTGYRFAIIPRAGKFIVRMSPGFNSAEPELHVYDWPTLVGVFGNWVRTVTQEDEAPDLWLSDAPLSAVVRSVADAPDSPEPFGREERRDVARALDDLARELREGLRENADRVAGLEAMIRELKGSSERLGRKDWTVMALSTFAGWGMSAAVDPATFHAAVAGFVAKIGTSLGLPGGH
jgi:hypothetical protein